MESCLMFSTAQLLEALDAKLGHGKGVAISDCLKINSASASRLVNGERSLKLDEAKKLVEQFGLQAPQPKVGPISPEVMRLLLLHVARSLGLTLRPDDPKIDEVARDLRMVLSLAPDSSVLQSEDAAKGFLLGLLHSRGKTP
jgi:hypothetical protein